MKLKDKSYYKAVWTIRKFVDADTHKQNKPYEVKSFSPNLLLNEGINELWTILCSSGGTKFDNANARLGVGNSNLAADPAQTGLQGTSKAYKAMDVGYPLFGTAQKATWRATYDGTEANFHWLEYTVINGADDTFKNLNRMVSDQSIKVFGQIWELTLEITLS